MYKEDVIELLLRVLWIFSLGHNVEIGVSRVDPLTIEGF